MSIDISLHGQPIEFEKEITVPLTKTVDTSGNEIVGLLIKLLSSEENVKGLKANIKITDKSVDFIRLLLNNCPEVFKTIEKDINVIIADGVLDIKDLPSVILIIKDVLNLNLDSIKSGVKYLTLQDSIQFIKDLLLILIEEDYIKVKDKNTIEKLICACIELLSSTINVNTTFVSLFKSIFSSSCCKK
jgi:hypothetical protein